MRCLRYLSLPVLVIVLAVASSAEVVISVSFAPPALPVYEQPLCPAEGYIWLPGYWAYDYDFDDYYWVPGTWVLGPEPGYLWTPPYWGWNGVAFIFHEGYWGSVVGFYGGINYGFGYFGEGYDGGRWEGNRFFYNRAVNNISVTNITNVYNNTTVIRNTTVNRVSYNGGRGGVVARPTPQQEAAGRERHIAPVAAQTQHMQAARSDPQLRASGNEGRPPIAATPRAAEFRGGGVVGAREAGAPYHPPVNRGERGGPARGSEPREGNNTSGFNRPVPRPENSRPAVHPNDLPPLERPAPRNTGNAKADQKYQQQEEKLYAKQQQDRQKLQQRQDQEHEKLTRQNASQARQQQLEQRHQQQTQQMVERHQAQQQKAEPKPPRGEPH